jgi:predicted phosphodiesterase
MRVLHLTDLHVQRPPRLIDLVTGPKRIIGAVNLYLLGRRAHFSAVVQQALVQTAEDLRPDVVVCTGDVTAIATDDEFEAARTLLRPLLERQPFVLLAGNHDTYVREAHPGANMRRWFGPWMGPRGARLQRVGEAAFLTVETCRAHLTSRGHTPPGELERAATLLDTLGMRNRTPEEEGLFVFWCQHYPLRGRGGAPYGPATRCLADAAEVEAVLAVRPEVSAVLHGHEHHGYRAAVTGPRGPIPTLNPGASGYAWLPKRRRTAHFCVYDVEGGHLKGVERYAWDGARFAPEAGGAFASGG